MSQPNLLGRTVQQTQEWLKALAGDPAIADEDQALTALRGVLGQLRDRMPEDEAAHLGAQLPTLVRGLYYENYRPSDMPETERNRTDFLVRVAERMDDNRIQPTEATRAVFALLSKELDQGEITDVVHMMPDDVKTLWPDDIQREAERKKGEQSRLN
jgi:uncharacterized protein (DUF2267 family)